MKQPEEIVSQIATGGILGPVLYPIAFVMVLSWGLSPWLADGGLLVWIAMISLGFLHNHPRISASGMLLGTALQLGWVVVAWRDGLGESGLPYWCFLTLWQWIPLAVAIALTQLTRDRLGLPVASGLAWSAAQLLCDVWQFFPASAALFAADTHYWLWPAAIGGTTLLTGLIAAIGALCVTSPRRALLLWVSWGGIGALLPHLGGTEKTLKIGIIQPDVHALDARTPSVKPWLQERILTLISHAEANGAALVVAPEGAWPADPGAGTGARRAAFIEAFSGHPPVAIGATIGSSVRSNSMISLEEGRVRRVDKHTLVPLWERSLWGWGDDLYQPGAGRPHLYFQRVSLGVLICYEDGFPDRLQQAHGADILLTPTNDSWMGPGAGSRTHLNAARLAAVISGTWLVRPALTGRSAVFDRWGALVWSAPWVNLPYLQTTGHVGVVDVGIGPGDHPGVWAHRWVGFGALCWLGWALLARWRGAE